MELKEYTFDELRIGQKEAFEVVITSEMEEGFRRITGDINPMHIDDEFARNMSGGKYTSHIAFGMLTASFISTLAGVYLPGKYSLIHSVEIGFAKPVFAQDILTVSGEITDKQEDLKLIVVTVRIKNQNGKTVLKGTMKNILQK